MIDKVEVDLEKKVVIVHTSSVTPEKLLATIAKTGKEVRLIEA